MGNGPQRLDRVLAQAAGGDADAWRVLVETYTRRVYGLLVRQCNDPELAQEITQETFVKVVAGIGRYHEQGKFEPWLFRIAMNGLRDEMRRRKRQARSMDMSPGSGAGASGAGAAQGGEGDGAWAAAELHVVNRTAAAAEDPWETASRAEQIERLKRAIARMNPADQQILHLRHTAGLSFAQIAATLGQPLGTVLARGHRALGKLRELMREEDDPRKGTEPHHKK